MRKLSPEEQEKLKILTQNSVSLALIQPTETALKKSIIDATGPVRNFLRQNNIHNYNHQDQGPKNKVLLNSAILTDKKSI
tara:strand:+ start:1951 stop:2190 length:240 start_codon:yes stop_codon:yes gene_type:complete